MFVPVYAFIIMPVSPFLPTLDIIIIFFFIITNMVGETVSHLYYSFTNNYSKAKYILVKAIKSRLNFFLVLY